MIKYVRAIIQTMRPSQWIKNIFLYAPLIFGGLLFNSRDFILVSAGVVIFSLASGCVYIINDLVDIKNDREHPVKVKRPLASGSLSPKQAVSSVVLLLPCTLVCGFALTWNFGVLLLTYVSLNMLYSFLFKKIVILDVMTIAVGFVIRVWAGAEIAAIITSDWLLICTLLLSLFLGFSKRRHELTLLDTIAIDHRKVLDNYNTDFLDQMIGIVTASTVMSYILYTISSDTINKFGTHHLFYTVPFVLYGIFRYLYLIHKKDQGGSPDRTLVSDIPLLLNIMLWGLSSILIIYFHV
jgi:4-hydroxybenzoate polyprenyltransferase